MTTELLTDPGHTRQDLRQIESAIRKGWIIPEQLLEALPKTAAVIALKGKPRDQIAAMALLVKMKESNDKAEGVDRPQAQSMQTPQTTINVGVNVENRTDSGRDPLLAIAERVKAAVVLRDSAGDRT